VFKKFQHAADCVKNLNHSKNLTKTKGQN